jgi:hypothetical protein
MKEMTVGDVFCFANILKIKNIGGLKLKKEALLKVTNEYKEKCIEIKFNGRGIDTLGGQGGYLLYPLTFDQESEELDIWVNKNENKRCDSWIKLSSDANFKFEVEKTSNSESKPGKTKWGVKIKNGYEPTNVNVTVGGDEPTI